ncbi:hypothetical protein IMCC3317_02180 [Kordia antarctica]|uniref:DUF3037 domain-containing protein n=1 Tax=Kordia antarctica TaxID=1218801 RepID=A0A7L4ZDN6_9FLAO|nr:DUF3037 domain-containing protein [Kordia antarctica]QHI34873.1 hypothetical protein IMCC3317_02180 [Kordia antarctica]
MQDKVTFEYAIIRFMPKVEREEFFNIGVIVFSKRKKFLGLKYHIDAEKLAAFSCEITRKELTEYLKAWEFICKGTPNGGAIGAFEISDRFRWLAASKSTMILCSPTHSGLCHDPSIELEDIFEKYVL